MAIKRAQPKLKRHRRLLLRNCEDLITRFETAKDILEVGEASTKAAMKIMTSSGASDAGPSESYYVGSLKASDLLVLVHAGLIQEWNIFLDSVFAEVVLYYLERGDRSALPSQRVDLDKLDPKSLADLRSTISNAARESFSLEPYRKRIGMLTSIFSIKKDLALDKEMTIHVVIRNIFQHNRGQIRPTDLAKIGQNGFEVLDEDGDKKQYTAGQKIELSLPELEHLKVIIKQYSEKFEVLP